MKIILMLLALVGCAYFQKDHRCDCDSKAALKMAPVEFDGHCAMGLCRKGQKVKCDPEITAVFKGKNYCFSSLEARETFMKDVEKDAKKAQAIWGANFGGSKN